MKDIKIIKKSKVGTLCITYEIEYLNDSTDNFIREEIIINFKKKCGRWVFISNDFYYMDRDFILWVESILRGLNSNGR